MRVELNIEDTQVIIPFGERFLVISRGIFEEALRLGDKFICKREERSCHDTGKLMDANEASEWTGKDEKSRVPASWFLEAARQGRIPHIKMGKYVRFRMSDVIQALEIRPGQEAKVTSARIKAI